MNAEMRVLQAIDAAQQALRRIPEAAGAERARLAHDAVQQIAAAPWSAVLRSDEADPHGWLSEMRDALLRIERDPESDDAPRRAEAGLWAADELERDLRITMGARPGNLAMRDREMGR